MRSQGQERRSAEVQGLQSPFLSWCGLSLGTVGLSPSEHQAAYGIVVTIVSFTQTARFHQRQESVFMQAEVTSCGAQPRFLVILLLNGAENHPAFLKCSEHDSITALPPQAPGLISSLADDVGYLDYNCP